MGALKLVNPILGKLPKVQTKLDEKIVPIKGSSTPSNLGKITAKANLKEIICCLPDLKNQGSSIKLVVNAELHADINLEKQIKVAKIINFSLLMNYYEKSKGQVGDKQENAEKELITQILKRLTFQGSFTEERDSIKENEIKREIALTCEDLTLSLKQSIINKLIQILSDYIGSNNNNTILNSIESLLAEINHIKSALSLAPQANSQVMIPKNKISERLELKIALNQLFVTYADDIYSTNLTTSIMVKKINNALTLIPSVVPIIEIATDLNTVKVTIEADQSRCSGVLGFDVYDLQLKMKKEGEKLEMRNQIMKILLIANDNQNFVEFISKNKEQPAVLIMELVKNKQECKPIEDIGKEKVKQEQLKDMLNLSITLLGTGFFISPPLIKSMLPLAATITKFGGNVLNEILPVLRKLGKANPAVVAPQINLNPSEININIALRSIILQIKQAQNDELPFIDLNLDTFLDLLMSSSILQPTQEKTSQLKLRAKINEIQALMTVNSARKKLLLIPGLVVDIGISSVPNQQTLILDTIGEALKLSVSTDMIPKMLPFIVEVLSLLNPILECNK